MGDDPGVAAPLAEESVRDGLALALAEHCNSTEREREMRMVRAEGRRAGPTAGAFARLLYSRTAVAADERHRAGLHAPDQSTKVTAHVGENLDFRKTVLGLEEADLLELKMLLFYFLILFSFNFFFFLIATTEIS